MGIDLLREHLRTLAVQPRRQRLTRNVTPHPCIVAHAWSARKDLAKTTCDTLFRGMRASSSQSPNLTGFGRRELLAAAMLLALIGVRSQAVCSLWRLDFVAMALQPG
jgi:hypothetical protein